MITEKSVCTSSFLMRCFEMSQDFMNECVTGLIVAVELLFDRISVSKFYDKLRKRV